MTRLVIILTLVLLAGCQSIPEGSNCKFWDNIPKSPSEQAWREFDCPFVGMPNV